MEIMVYAVTHVTISASEPDANGFSDTRVFGTMEEAKEKLRIWRDEELECRRESNARYVVYTDTDTKFHCTWDLDNEGIIITIRECEIKTPTQDTTTMETKTFTTRIVARSDEDLVRHHDGKIYFIYDNEGNGLFDIYEDSFIHLTDEGILDPETCRLTKRMPEGDIKHLHDKYGLHVEMLDTDMLLKETIVMLTADLWSEVYDRCEGCTEAASMLIGLAERFERELDWRGADETRDYLEELAKFEDKVRDELQK